MQCQAQPHCRYNIQCRRMMLSYWSDEAQQHPSVCSFSYTHKQPCNRAYHLAGHGMAVAMGVVANPFPHALPLPHPSSGGFIKPLTPSPHSLPFLLPSSGGFIKRDGRPRDDDVLVSRLVDRPIRPMFNKGWAVETQVCMRFKDAGCLDWYRLHTWIAVCCLDCCRVP